MKGGAPVISSQCITGCCVVGAGSYATGTNMTQGRAQVQGQTSPGSTDRFESERFDEARAAIQDGAEGKGGGERE